MMKKQYQSLLLGALSLSVLVLGGCSTEEKLDLTPTTEKMKRAQTALDRRDFAGAIKDFRDLVGRFQQGEQNEKVRLKLLYSYYANQEFEEVLATSDAFFRTYPKSQYLPYVSYVTALSQIRQSDSILQDFFGIDRSVRAARNITLALSHMNFIIANYPQSHFADRAKLWRDYLIELEAKHYLDVAKFYYKRSAYVAVVNRVEAMANKYPHQQATKEALWYLEQSYRALHLHDSADKALQQATELVVNEGVSKPAYDTDLLPDIDLFGDSEMVTLPLNNEILADTPLAVADDDKASDEKVADEKVADEKVADEKVADEKVADEKATDEKQEVKE